MLRLICQIKINNVINNTTVWLKDNNVSDGSDKTALIIGDLVTFDVVVSSAPVMKHEKKISKIDTKIIEDFFIFDSSLINNWFF